MGKGGYNITSENDDILNKHLVIQGLRPILLPHDYELKPFTNILDHIQIGADIRWHNSLHQEHDLLHVILNITRKVAAMALIRIPFEIEYFHRCELALCRSVDKYKCL